MDALVQNNRALALVIPSSTSTKRLLGSDSNHHPVLVDDVADARTAVAAEKQGTKQAERERVRERCQ